jgi:formylglycine-generating enzyme required for sulfatase activity
MPADAMGSFIRVDGGGFIKGADGLYPEEGRPAKVFVSSFLLQSHEVTNDQFAAFVDSTGYVTDAEKGGGSARFVETTTPQSLMSWWRLDEGATWRTPNGVGSDLIGKGRHPVVHVTLGDARAYAAWAGGRLPNEVEWEYAATLGLFDPDDPESGVRGPDGEPRANTWDGQFPTVNTVEDGFVGTAPVGCFPASRINAYDMIGNVWEWTETPFDRGAARFTIKGGSYLCGSQHCRRYRAAARQGIETNFSTAHVGFRIVKDIDR